LGLSEITLSNINAGHQLYQERSVITMASKYKLLIYNLLLSWHSLSRTSSVAFDRRDAIHKNVEISKNGCKLF